MAPTPEEFGALLGTIFMGTGMLILARAWARKIENQSKLPKATPESAERMQRMQRMERAIDAVALEVERISESQRFLTKLLADQEHGPAAALPRTTSSREGTS